MGGFKNIFFAWWQHDEYRITASADFKLTDEEAAIKLKYDLDNDQMYWRRKTIEEDFNNNIDDFDEQYPDCWEKAFKAKGSLVFGGIKRTLEGLLNQKCPRGKIGRMVRSGPDQVAFNECDDGNVEMLERPIEGEAYVNGTDVGEGIKDKEMAEYVDENGKQIKTSYSTSVIIRVNTETVVAIMECRLSEPVFADESMLLSYYYNTALWGVEIPGPGKAVLGRVIPRPDPQTGEMKGYPNLFMNEFSDRKDDNRQKKEYGWRNSSTSKPIAEADCEAFVREHGEKVRSNRITGQMLTYVIDQHGNHRPKVGCFADLLWGYMIALRLLTSRQIHTERVKHSEYATRKPPARRKRGRIFG